MPPAFEKKTVVLKCYLYLTKSQREQLENLAARDDRRTNNWVQHLVVGRLKKTKVDGETKPKSGT